MQRTGGPFRNDTPWAGLPCRGQWVTPRPAGLARAESAADPDVTGRRIRGGGTHVRSSGRSQWVGATLPYSTLGRGARCGAWGLREVDAGGDDQVWLRIRTGQAAKQTARELRLCVGTVRAYLVRCGGIRHKPRRRAAGRLRLEEREETRVAWRPDTRSVRSQLGWAGRRRR